MKTILVLPFMILHGVVAVVIGIVFVTLFLVAFVLNGFDFGDVFNNHH